MEQGIVRTKTVTTPKDNSLVKIAVQMLGKTPQLIELNQRQPLQSVIQELCSYWNLTDPETYALRFNLENSRSFVSEKNRMEVKNGYVLELGFSPSKIAQGILKQLSPQSSNEEKQKGAADLVVCAGDIAFAAEFIDKQGIEMLIGYVENMENGRDPVGGQLLASLVDLMDHGLAAWDVVELTFIKKIASFVNNQQQTMNGGDGGRTLQAALSILESLANHSTNKCVLVERELTLPNLAMHLQNNSPAVQQNTLALINALLIKADDSKRVVMSKTLNTRQIRNAIVMSIIQGGLIFICLLGNGGF